jgi:protein XagA
MSSRIDLGRVLAIGFAMAPTAAFAGAWTLDAGEGQAIVTATPSTGDKAFDRSSKLQSISRYDKDELDALIEYGVTDRFTLMLSPSAQHVGIAAPTAARRTGPSYTEAGGRVRLLQGDSWVFSVQTTLAVPGTFDRSNPAAIGYTDTELDVRGLLGYSFKVGSWPAFVDLELGQRFRYGGPPNEARADFTLGVQPFARWQLLAQSFNVISEGAGSWGLPAYSYHKFQLSAVYAVTPAWSLQLGAFTTYWGRNALQENGVIASAWYKF